MMQKLLRRMTVAALLAALLALAAPTFAQEDLDAVYVSEAFDISFRYPSNWGVNEITDNDLVVLVDPSSTVSVAFFGPQTLADGNLAEYETAEDLVINAMDGASANLEPGKLFEYEIDGRTVYQYTYVDSEGRDGFFMAVDFSSGMPGLVTSLGFGGDIYPFEDTILAIVATFDDAAAAGGEADSGSGGKEDDAGSVTGSGDATGPAETLTDFDRGWRRATTELTDLGVIPGGALLFEEDYAFFTGQGGNISTLGRSVPRVNVVIAAQILFTPSGAGYETCALLARTNFDSRGVTTDFLDLGVNSDGEAYAVDRFGSGDDDVTAEFVPLDLDFDVPHHIMAVVFEDTLLLYVDGELVIDGMALDTRGGVYGVGLRGQARGAACEATDIWVFEIAAGGSAEGTCVVTAINNVNQRSGPGTNFDRAGTLAAGSSSTAVGQAQGSDGQTWWELEDGTWVREDTVTEQGACDALPVTR